MMFMEWMPFAGAVVVLVTTLLMGVGHARSACDPMRKCVRGLCWTTRKHLFVAARGCGVNWQNFGPTPQDRAGPAVLNSNQNYKNNL